MNSFTNQYNFRVDNQLKIISALRNGPVSLNDLAEKINISFTAIVKIAEQLKDQGVILSSKKQITNRKGRKPSYVKINTKVGVTCAIDLSGEEIVVAISDLTNHIIAEEVVTNDYFISENTIGKIKESISKLLAKPEINNRPLLGICVAAPGMINKNTGEFADSFRLKELKNFSVANYLFNNFGVPTDIYNDVKIGLVGERIFGCLPIDAKNYMFVHIGSGCSTALSIEGKLYQGSNGYSGELSSYANDDFFKPRFTNNHLEGLSHIASRVDKIDPSLNVSINKFVANREKLIELFNDKNPIVLDAIKENARINAVQIIAYNDLLDLEYFVISGSILTLGDYYKECLLNSINDLVTTPFRAKILFSSYTVDPTLMGTVYHANNLYFLRKLEEITNQKSSTGKYDISEAFGNNI